MATHVTFKAGQVSSMSSGTGDLSGQGFNIVNQHGRPLISFLYPAATEAQAARAQIEAALVDAIVVVIPGP